ncbi:MAG: sigma 54-interacting transcriptional regulator [Polyangiaceae bacterium]
MTERREESETKAHDSPNAKVSVRRHPRIDWQDAKGAHTAIANRAFLIGSAARADLEIADPTVSRLHAEMEPRHDGIWIRDLGSKNGTYVDGVQVVMARVPERGTIRLGSTVIAVSPADVETRVELWPDPHFGSMVGSSVAMRELFATIARVAATTSTVLVQGETGTGKELVAHALHDASPRKEAPFVVVDCAALPENLLESELFGHAKGAFTGASQSREGAFESANGGTLFLDEIGELPLSMQPKLLRVLESKTVRRLGETNHRPIDVRIVSATHRDLRAMVVSGAFREDLYFRLAVLPLQVPPLRQHMDDVIPLLDHFLPSATPDQKTELLREALDLPWLGNVRELRNFVERAVAFGAKQARAMTSIAPPPPSEKIATEATSAGDSAFAASFEKSFRDFHDDVEREYLKRLLARHNGNVTAAAQAAGIDRTYIYRLVRKYER